jgi:hypothetical protein
VYRPPYIVIDFETEEHGCGSTEYYRPDFRVSSAAFSWIGEFGGIESKFITGEDSVALELTRIADESIPIVAHNAQFEIGVLRCRFPELSRRLSWEADTMRLVQVFDNGGDPNAYEFPDSLDDQLDALDREESDVLPDLKKKKRPKAIALAGLGLVKSCYRIMKLPNHKEEAYEWIRANVPECRRGKEGGFLNRLPFALLERYNVGDTEATLKLYRHTVAHFYSIGYDWRLDHGLFFSSVDRIVEAKIRGVDVDRQALELYRQQIVVEIEGIGRKFREDFLDPILRVERKRLLSEVRKRKTLRGRKSYLRRLRHAPDGYAGEIGFNIGSNHQLEALFVGELKLPTRFQTDSGRPSFRSAVLSQWGAGGEILKTRRKRMLVLKQVGALLELTTHDGRWHCDLKAAACATGRYAGGVHA